MGGQGKITLVIKRASAPTPSVQHATGLAAVQSSGGLSGGSLPDHAQITQHVIDLPAEKEADRSRLSQLVSRQPGSWAIAGGLVFAALAAASVVKLTDTLPLKAHLTTLGQKPSALEQRSGLQPPAESIAPVDIPIPTALLESPASHEVKQPEPHQEAPVTAPRRAQAPKVQPRFPDAFRGEAQVTEQVIARPKKRSPHGDAVQPEQFPGTLVEDSQVPNLGQEGSDHGLPD